MIGLERCWGCDAPIAAWEWIHCVTIDRAGTRAHRACLEMYGLPCRPDCAYLLVRRTTSAGTLRAGARFCLLATDSVVVEVPAAILTAQQQAFQTAGVGGEQVFDNPGTARLVAEGAISPAEASFSDTRQLRGTAAPPTAQSPMPPGPLPSTPVAPPSNLRLVRNTVSRNSPWALLIFEWDPSPDARVWGYELEMIDSRQGRWTIAMPAGQTVCGTKVPRGLWFGATLCAMGGPTGQSTAIQLRATAAR